MARSRFPVAKELIDLEVGNTKLVENTKKLYRLLWMSKSSIFSFFFFSISFSGFFFIINENDKTELSGSMD